MSFISTPENGAKIMERVEMLKEIAPLTLYHHENMTAPATR
jgi:hypothetical protein